MDGENIGEVDRDEGGEDHDEDGPASDASPGDPPHREPDGERGRPDEPHGGHRLHRGAHRGADHQQDAGEDQGDGRRPDPRHAARSVVAHRVSPVRHRKPLHARGIGSPTSQLEPDGPFAHAFSQVTRVAAVRGALRSARTRAGGTVPGRPAGRRRTHEESSDEPLPLRRPHPRPPHAARTRDPPGRGARCAALDGRRGGPLVGVGPVLGHHVLRRPRPLRLPQRGVRAVLPRQRAPAGHVPVAPPGSRPRSSP